MKKRKNLFLYITTLIFIICFVAVDQGKGQENVFTDSFDDPALPGWEHSPNAEVTNGILRIEPDGFAFHPGEWGNLELNVLARYMGEGAIVINYRVREEGGYSVILSKGEIRLFKGESLLDQRPTEQIPEEEWFFIHIIALGEAHEILLNGEVVLSYNDPNVLSAGGIALAAQGGAIGEFEEITVISIESPEQESGTQPFPTTEGAEKKTTSGEFPVEAIIRYDEDMENLNFDAVIAKEGNGSYAVVDEGNGNHIARMSGTKLLEMRDSAWPARTWEDYDLVLKVKESGNGKVGFGIRWLAPFADAMSVTNLGYWLDHSGDQWTLYREIHGEKETIHATNANSPVNEWYELKISARTVEGGAEIKAYANTNLIFEYTDTSEPFLYGGIGFRTEGDGVELWLDDVQVIEYVDSRFTWTQANGPEGAHGLGGVAVDPRDWRVIYAGGLDSDLFKSTDGGASWKMIGLPNELWTNRFRIIKLAPSNPDIVYAGAGGKHISPFWRSEDGGDTWHWMNVDGSEFLPEADTIGIAIDPNDPMHVYFSMGTGIGVVPLDISGIYETFDGGETYSPIYSGAFIGPVEIDPGNKNHLLAGSISTSDNGYSVVASMDGGKTWQASDRGMNGEDIKHILFHPNDPSYVFAVAYTLKPEEGAAVYRSTDGGASWHKMPALPTANFILSTNQAESVLLAFRVDGIYRSEDKGETWDKTGSENCSANLAAIGTNDPNVLYTISSPNIKLSLDLGKTCNATSTEGFLAHAIVGIGVAPSNPAVVYVGTMSGVFKSTDYGKSWELIRGRALYAGIAVDPIDSNTVYIGGVETSEILKSTDGGKTWADVSGPITFPGIANLVIDPNDNATIYAGTGHGPQFGPGGAGLYKSTDGGNSWTRLGGIPDGAVTAIEIFEKDSNVIAVGVMGYGVYVSQDGGENFELRINGMTTTPDGETVSPNVWALAIDPRDYNIMYAGTVKHDGYGAFGGYQALYKTTDGGKNWTILLGWNTPGEYQFLYFGAGVDDMVINPERPDEIYVALHDPGIIFSENGGQDWRFINHGLVPLMTHIYPYRMVISPDGGVLYATTCGRSIYLNNLNQTEDTLPNPDEIAEGERSDKENTPGERVVPEIFEDTNILIPLLVIGVIVVISGIILLRRRKK